MCYCKHGYLSSVYRISNKSDRRTEHCGTSETCSSNKKYLSSFLVSSWVISCEQGLISSLPLTLEECKHQSCCLNHNVWIICYYDVTYTFQNEFTLYVAWMSRNSLLKTGAISDVLSDCNRSWTCDHLVRKRTLNHLAKLAKWLSVRLQTKWLWVRIPLLSLKQYMKFEKMAAFSAIIVVEIWFSWDAFIAPPFFISFIISLDFTRLKVKSGLLLENFFAKILQWLQYYSTACKVGFRTLLVSDSQEFPICHYSDFFTSDKFVQKFLLYSLKTFK